MSRPDKDGESKEGAGRVALYRETGLLHLYTVESNYNTVRAPGMVPPCSSDGAGRASPASGRRPTPRLTADLLQVDMNLFMSKHNHCCRDELYFLWLLPHCCGIIFPGCWACPSDRCP
jgi:hypothetical protein